MTGAPRTAADRLATWLRRVARERVFLATLGIALVVPLGVSFARGNLVVGLPLIFNGDEVHYLVALSSLVDDGDLDLRNDYEGARRGGPQAGQAFAAEPLDHHTVWFAADGSRHSWWQMFEMPGPGTPRVDGIPEKPRLQAGVKDDFADRPERSNHPAGLPLLVAPLAVPFRGTRFVEPLAIALTALVTFATALFTRRLFRVFSSDPGVVNTATLLTILGTPIWAYARIFECEAWLACACTGAMALALGSDAYAVAGVLIAIGTQMKPPFALVAAPLVVDVLLRRDCRRVVTLCVPLAFGVALVLGLNEQFFGAPLRAAQAWESGNLVTGALGLLVSWNHGLFTFAPVVAVALYGWPSLFRTHRRQAWILASSFAGYFLLMALWRDWRGGYCYGPRLIVPIIPIAMAGVVRAVESLPNRSAGVQRRVEVVCALSLLVSAIGGVASFGFWGSHPLFEPIRYFLAQRG